MPKKNGFLFFMLKRKEDMAKDGVRLARGLVELAERINGEWLQMASEEKEVYKKMADEHNALVAEKKKSEAAAAAAIAPAKPPSPEHSFKKFVQHLESVARDEGWETDCMTEIREMLITTVKYVDSAKMPVLILNFSLYNDEPKEALLPAEVGLSVFTVQDGIIENFSALIDPGPEIPENVRESVAQSAIKLALPFPNYDVRAQNYGAVLDRIFQIGKLYAHYYNGAVTFSCLQKDWVSTEICIKWLMHRAGIYTRGLQAEFDFHLIPLDILLTVMTSQKYTDHYEAQLGRLIQKVAASRAAAVSGGTFFSTLDLDEEDEMDLSRGEMGEALAAMKIETELFGPVFPSGLPSVKEGVFVQDAHVAGFLNADNYAYHPQLACSYHAVRQDGVYFCPLNVGNRYAYNLLHVLVAPFRIPPRPGCHYPTLQWSPEAEGERRLEMVRKWEVFSPIGLGIAESVQDQELVEARQSRLEERWESRDRGQDGDEGRDQGGRDRGQGGRDRGQGRRRGSAESGVKNGKGKGWKKWN